MKSKPIFEIISKTKKYHIKIYFDGHVEGIESLGDCYIINRYLSHYDRLLASKKLLASSCPTSKPIRR